VTGTDPGSPDLVAELAGKIRAAHPRWEIHAHPAGLGLWSAEWQSGDGRMIHYIVCHTGEELAAKLEIVDAGTPS
jgi:hypothetical protein